MNNRIFISKINSKQDNYKLISSLVQPRPIAWVSTISNDGIHNLAPFSFFSVVSRDPLTLGISLTRKNKDGNLKDTLVNIKQNQQFVVNIPTKDQISEVSDSAFEWDAEINEFEKAGLKAEKSNWVKAPGVKDAICSIECRLRDSIEIGSDTLVLGSVIGIVIKTQAVDQNLKVTDFSKWLGRLSGPNYGTDWKVHNKVM